MIRKMTIPIVLIFCTSIMKAQSKTDAISIFKMQLFLDKPNVLVNNDSCTKNDSLYFAFSKIVLLELDTLKVNGNYDFVQSVFSPKYEFYSICLSSNKLNSLEYKRKMTEKESNYLGVFSGVFNKYIIAIDKRTGRSYRIIGFNGNDFLGFLSDYLEYYNEHNEKKATISNFLKNYRVEGIDFRCLYEGLTAKEIDRKKYFCLQRVNDPFLIH